MRLGTTALVLLAVLATGCEGEVTRDGDRIVIAMAPHVKAWLIAVPVVLALVAIGIAVGKYRRDGLIMLAAVVVVSGLLVPGIYRDHVIVTATGVWQTTGFWFTPNVKGFDFADVRDIHIETRAGKRVDNDIWVLGLRGGGRRELDPGDLWEHNSGVITPVLHQHGIPVVRDE